MKMLVSNMAFLKDVITDNLGLKLVAGILASLFATPPILVGLIIVLVIANFITGVRKSFKKGKKFQAEPMWKMADRVVGIIFFLGCTTAFANTFDLFAFVQDACYVFVAVYLLKSITENLFGEESDFWVHFKGLINFDDVNKNKQDKVS